MAFCAAFCFAFNVFPLTAVVAVDSGLWKQAKSINLFVLAVGIVADAGKLANKS